MSSLLQRRFVGPIFGLGGLLVLCGASPAPEGNETTVAVGMGAYEHRSGGCGGTRRSYSVSEPTAHLQVRHLTSGGNIWAGEASVGIGMLGESREDPNEVNLEDDLLDADQTFWSGVVAARWGRQGRFYGFELGPALALHNRLGGLTPVPSGGLWVGKPTLAYAWADAFRGPFSGAIEFAGMVGIGHSSRFIRAEVGSNSRAHVANLDVRVGQGVRLGLHGGYGMGWVDQTSPDLRGMLRLTIDYRTFSRPSTP